MSELSVKHIEECLMCVETHIARQAAHGPIEALGLMAARARGELEALEEIKEARAFLIQLAPKALMLATALGVLEIKCPCGRSNCDTLEKVLEVAADIICTIEIRKI